MPSWDRPLASSPAVLALKKLRSISIFRLCRSRRTHIHRAEQSTTADRVLSRGLQRDSRTTALGTALNNKNNNNHTTLCPLHSVSGNFVAGLPSGRLGILSHVLKMAAVSLSRVSQSAGSVSSNVWGGHLLLLYYACTKIVVTHLFCFHPWCYTHRKADQACQIRPGMVSWWPFLSQVGVRTSCLSFPTHTHTYTHTHIIYIYTHTSDLRPQTCPSRKRW